MVSVDLRRRLQDQRCPEKGDIIAHFAILRTMREDLAAMGQPLSENDFYAIILGSLPGSYDPYISAVNATSGVLGKTISADNLILTITEEYECRNLKSKNGKKDENVALYSNDAKKGRKEGSSSKKNVKCYNCKKKGHYKSECWAPGGGKEGQGPNQKGKGKAKAKETAGMAKEKDEDKEKEKQVEEAWLAMINESELPDLVDCSDSEDEDELPNLVDCSDSEDEDDLVKEINNQSKMSDKRSRLQLVLPKFSSELIQRTRTDRTEPKVLFCSVLVLSVLCSVRFLDFSDNQNWFGTGLNQTEQVIIST